MKTLKLFIVGLAIFYCSQVKAQTCYDAFCLDSAYVIIVDSNTVRVGIKYTGNEGHLNTICHTEYKLASGGCEGFYSCAPPSQWLYNDSGVVEFILTELSAGTKYLYMADASWEVSAGPNGISYDGVNTRWFSFETPKSISNEEIPSGEEEKPGSEKIKIFFAEKSIAVIGEEDGELSFFNSLGQLVFVGRIEKGRNHISLSLLSPGFYLYTLETKNQIRTGKIIR